MWCKDALVQDNVIKSFKEHWELASVAQSQYAEEE